jgi:arylsulfatase A-like enzyme
MMVLWWLWSCSLGESSRPDVLLVTVDTLRADHLGFMGHESAHTPRMDIVAGRALVFEQATTPFPRTTPALASLLTGLLPLHHGSREVGQPMTSEHTLASALSQAGYTTVAVSAIRVASPEQNIDRGFSSFEVLHDAAAPQITEAALQKVKGVRGPLFLWVHYADPHFPYLPHPHAPLQPSAPGCRALGEAAAAGKLERAKLFSDRDGMASAVLQECVELYDAEIAAVDEAIGQLLDGLGTMRSSQPRFLVFTSDHGEHHGEGKLFFEHGPAVDEAVTHVPLLIAGPGVQPGRDSGTARLQDIAPTLLDALDLREDQPAMDGASLWPRMMQREGGSSGLVSLIESGSALHVPLFRYLVSGRGERWCLNEERWSWCTLPKRGAGLYDHEADPDLTTARQQEEPERAQRLAEATSRWKPEQARRYAARTESHELVALPRASGGYDLQLYSLPAGTPTEDEAISKTLTEALRSLQGEIHLEARDERDEQLLRSLGYIE